MKVNELHYKTPNAQVTEALKAEGIVIEDTLTVVDIRDTKSPEKKTVYAVGTTDIGTQESADYGRMSIAERLSQEFPLEMLMRGRITFTNSMIEKLKIQRGAKLSANGVDFVVRVYEQHEPFYVGQQPVQRKNAQGVLEPVLRNGKKFFRDTKVVTREELATTPHQLLKDLNTAGLTE